MTTMTTVLRQVLPAAAILTAAAIGFGAAAAQAGTYGNAPWCAVVNTGTGDVSWDCEFRSAEECAPNVIAGNRGFCNLNPYFVPPVAATPGKYRKHSS